MSTTDDVSATLALSIGADWDVTSNDVQFVGRNGGADIAMVVGLASFQQRFYHLCITASGTYLTHGEWGVGAGSFVGTPFTAETIALIQGRVMAGLQEFPEVGSVQTVLVTFPGVGLTMVTASVVFNGAPSSQNVSVVLP